ncbi:hypothetical protein IAT40_000039 [Kwoniella sp. CBS 6097]
MSSSPFVPDGIPTILYPEAGPSTFSSFKNDEDIFALSSTSSGIDPPHRSTGKTTHLKRNRTMNLKAQSRHEPFTTPTPKDKDKDKPKIEAEFEVEVETEVGIEHEESAPPGPSRKPFMAPRSHSAPSLTPWTGTPSKGMKRSWNPATNVEACVKVEHKKMEGVLSPVLKINGGIDANGKGKGKGKGKSSGVVVGMDGVEKGSSELYISHERSTASHKDRERARNRHEGIEPTSTPTKIRSKHSTNSNNENEQSVPGCTDIIGTERLPKLITATASAMAADVGPSNQASNAVRPTQQEEGMSGPAGETKRSWRRSIVGGAYNAGVLGAALGLTAYRLISNRGITTPVNQVEDAAAAIPSTETDAQPRACHPSSQPDDERAAEQAPHDSGSGLELGSRGGPNEAAGDSTVDIETATGPDEREQAQINTGGQTSRTELVNDHYDARYLASTVSHLPAQVQSRVEHNLPPPPAYEETVGRETTLKGAWEDLDDECLVTPSSSRMATLNFKHQPCNRGPYRLSSSSSSYALSTSRSSPRTRKYKVKPRLSARALRNLGIYHHLSLSSSRSMPTIEIEDQDQDRDQHLNISGSFTSSIAAKDIETSKQARDLNPIARHIENEDDDLMDPVANGEGPDAMMTRLDSMSARLEELISQGKKALESTALPRTGTTPGWEDENPLDAFTQGFTTTNTSNGNEQIEGQLRGGTEREDDADGVGFESSLADTSVSSERRLELQTKTSRRQSRIPTKISPVSKHGHTHTHTHTHAGRHEEHIHAQAGSPSEVEGQRQFSTGQERRERLGLGSDGGSRIPVPVKSRSIASGLGGHV